MKNSSLARTDLGLYKAQPYINYQSVQDTLYPVPNIEYKPETPKGSFSKSFSKAFSGGNK